MDGFSIEQKFLKIKLSMSEIQNTNYAESVVDDDIVDLVQQTAAEADYLAFRHAMFDGLKRLNRQDRRQLYSRLKLEFKSIIE